MPRAKAETKDGKSKVKAQAKTKSHAKPKAHAKPATHTKSKVRAKVSEHKKPKTHAKPAAHVKTKTHMQPKAHAHPRAHVKTKTYKRPESKFEFDDVQTDTLLKLVERIVNLRKRKIGGLKTFYNIDRILDRYNQHFTHPIEKLDAIIKYGMEKDPAVVHQHFYVATDNREKEEDDLYKLLSGIGHGKIKFDDAKNKMQHIYEESSHEK